MRKLLLLFISIFLLISCSEKEVEKEVEIKSMNARDQSIHMLKDLVLKKGDIKAYYDLHVTYVHSANESFLPYALVMANKYDYPQAYFDVYNALLSLEGLGDEIIDWKNWNIKSKELAIKYLILASIKGHETARKKIKNKFIKGKELHEIMMKETLEEDLKLHVDSLERNVL